MKKDDTKTERILKLILFLNGPFAKSKDECCDFLDISHRKAALIKQKFMKLMDTENAL